MADTSSSSSIPRSSSSDSKSSSSASPSSSAGPASPTSEPSSEVSREEIASLRRAKSYYDVLGVPKSASQDDIKRNFKKLALRFHPDKCKTPGAEDGFKIINTAFATLRDPEKRASYDQFGTADPFMAHSASSPSFGGMRARGGGGGGGGTYRYYGTPMGDTYTFTDEDIFDIFDSVFNTHSFPRRRYAPAYPNGRAQHNRGTGGGGGGGVDGSSSFAFRNLLLPILIMLFFIVISFSGSYEKPLPFSVSQSREFPIQRKTIQHGLAYFVAEGFNEQFSSDPTQLREVERRVVQVWQSYLSHKCQLEQVQRYRNIQRTRQMYKGGSDFDAKQQEAENTPMPSCAKLHEILVTS